MFRSVLLPPSATGMMWSNSSTAVHEVRTAGEDDHDRRVERHTLECPFSFTSEVRPVGLSPVPVVLVVVPVVLVDQHGDAARNRHRHIVGAATAPVLQIGGNNP